MEQKMDEVEFDTEPKVNMIQIVEISKIRFKNLSGWLKLAAIVSWGLALIWGLYVVAYVFMGYYYY
jgi:hypothetical protein